MARPKFDDAAFLDAAMAIAAEHGPAMATVGAAETIDRVIDLFPRDRHNAVRSVLARTLRGVVCQRLLARAASAQVAHARLEYEMRRQELHQQRSELVGRAQVLRQSTEFAATRLAAADAAVQERGLRAARPGGDVPEQLQRARLQRYNAAKAPAEADKALGYRDAGWAPLGSFAVLILSAVVAGTVVGLVLERGRRLRWKDFDLHPQHFVRHVFRF